MCGIIGYSGEKNACEVLSRGLETLEYRGYDSAGVALFESGDIRVIKAKGKVSALKERLDAQGKIASVCGVGHTRWATHGKPSDINSHPHGTPRVQIVHNGIIENYRELRRELSDDGYTFKSETDTEVLACMLDKYYCRCLDPKKAILRTACRLKGSFALGIMFKDYPNAIYAIRHDSPLIVAGGEGEAFIASDITAILPYTRSYFVLPENTVARIKRGDVSFFDEDENKITLEARRANWDMSEAKRGGYAHYMLKEIHEQPEVLSRAISPRIVSSLPTFEYDGVDIERLARAKRIFIIGCGTAYHASLLGKHFFEKFTRATVFAEIASELRYSELKIHSDDVFIAVSQSGETADTLSALRLAKSAGAYTIGLINVVSSTMALEADATIYTLAGPEIAVASTKAYSVQCSLLCLLALALARHTSSIGELKIRQLCSCLLEGLPKAIDYVLKQKDTLADMARHIYRCQSLFFIGRSVDYFAIIEGSLKLKEISYIHSEAYYASELKHGTISLIEQGVPVVALCTVSRLADKLQSAIKEVKARGALTIGLASEATASALSDCDHSFFLPELDEALLPIVSVSALQLLAYYTALLRGCDIDHPRNLAKSVTVE